MTDFGTLRGYFSDIYYMQHLLKWHINVADKRPYLILTLGTSLGFILDYEWRKSTLERKVISEKM